MKAAPFDYYRAASAEQALELLQKLGDDAKILAGGQSLVPLMNFRLVRPAALVDINRIDGLAAIGLDGDRLHLGALARQAAVEASPQVREACPILTQAIRQVGHAAIRARGTVGGSVAHADPAAELPLLLVAMDGQIDVRSQGRQRTIPAGQFFVDALLTALEPAEMVTGLSFDTNSRWNASAFLELARRHGDFALTSVAVRLELAGGVCRDARIAIGGAAPTPVRAEKAEASLRGQRPDEAGIREAAVLASEATDPPSDVHGSGAYRRQLARVLVNRALHEALGLNWREERMAA